MAVKFVEVQGKKLAVAFSLRKIFTLCTKHNTDLDGLVGILSSGKLDEAVYEILLEIGQIGLNTGAERESSDERFTVDDVDAMFTEDISLIQSLVEAFIASLQGEKVFPRAAQKAQKPPKIKGGR